MYLCFSSGIIIINRHDNLYKQIYQQSAVKHELSEDYVPYHKCLQIVFEYKHPLRNANKTITGKRIPSITLTIKQKNILIKRVLP
jgi:hypothetical protein